MVAKSFVWMFRRSISPAFVWIIDEFDESMHLPIVGAVAGMLIEGSMVSSFRRYAHAFITR